MSIATHKAHQNAPSTSRHAAPSLVRTDIIACLEKIGTRMAAQNKMAEIVLYGGSAIALLFDYRPSTHDVDFTLRVGDRYPLYDIAMDVGLEQGLPPNWFNDAVSIFTSDNPETRILGEFPKSNPGIRVFTATPQYLLAMKLQSMRSSLESSDALDVWNLLDACGAKTPEDALALARKFYPDKLVERRAELLLMDFFEAKQANAEYDPMLSWGL